MAVNGACCCSTPCRSRTSRGFGRRGPLLSRQTATLEYPPASLAECIKTLRARFDRKNRELGIAGPNAVEVFRVTAWGSVPTMARLRADFPPMLPDAIDLTALEQRLKLWNR